MSNGQGTARQRLADVLQKAFVARNYAPAYLARRCRTSPDVVESWMSGACVPAIVEWNFLCSMSREFSAFSDLWSAARDEALADDLEHAGDRAEAAAVQARTAESIATPTTIPSTIPVATPVTTIDRPSVSSSASSSAPAGPPPRSSTEAEPILAASPRAAGARHAFVPIPAEFVVYICKIGRGVFVQIPLPMDLTMEDVDMLRVFLLAQVSRATQADDAGAENRQEKA